METTCFRDQAPLLFPKAKWNPSGRRTSLQRWSIVENRLTRRQRDAFRRHFTNVGSTLVTKRGYNVDIYNIRQFDLKPQRCFKVGLTLSYSWRDSQRDIHVASLLPELRWSNLHIQTFSTWIHRREGDFQRWFNVKPTQFWPRDMQVNRK